MVAIAHPIADLFPLMGEEDLADLAADIREHGLQCPIVLDKEGRVLDGRSRLRACERAGVTPRFITYDGDDPDVYALSVNIARAHLSQGQRAMIVVQAQRLNSHSSLVPAVGAAVSQGRVWQAAAVLDYAPDLANAVIAGASLSEAFVIAQQRKAQRDTRLQEEARQLRFLREQYPTYAAQVGAGTLTLSQALVAIQTQEEEKHSGAEAEELEHDARSALEKLGSGLPLTPASHLTGISVRTGMRQGMKTTDRVAACGRHQSLLRGLAQVLQELDAISALAQEVDDPLPGAVLGPVRDAITQIAAKAYDIADTLHATADGAPPRGVKRSK